MDSIYFYDDMMNLYKIYEKITHTEYTEDKKKIYRLNKNYNNIFAIDIINNLGSNNFMELIETSIIKKTQNSNLIKKFSKLKSSIEHNRIKQNYNSLCLGFIFLYFRFFKKPSKKNFAIISDSLKIKIDFIYL
jgi:hypothetical protein